ncbi:MAG: FolC bifunctional protein, partial [Verrucomicrobiaceae bacterium]|nr:FolC bifunctional protein [Verrucomicrobiaceae bacterium]
ILPKVTVITAISLDHQQILGNTLTEIAGEKAGIIKPGIPVVTIKQSPEVMEVISRTALERGAPLMVVTTPSRGYELGLAGQHQLWNAALAVGALKVLRFRLPEPVLRHGLKNVHWPARFQRLDDQERVVLDGAHNIDSADTLVRTWMQKYPGEKATIVFGATAAKDLKAIIKALQPIAGTWHFTGFQSPRAAPPEQLLEVQADAFGNACEAHVHQSPAEALAAAKKGEERVLITGSLYLAGEILAHVRGEDALFQCSAQ